MVGNYYLCFLKFIAKDDATDCGAMTWIQGDGTNLTYTAKFVFLQECAIFFVLSNTQENVRVSEKLKSIILSLLICGHQENGAIYGCYHSLCR